MTQKTNEDNEDDARKRKMAVKTETSPRTEAAPFSDRERVVKRRVVKKKRSRKTEGDPCSLVG